MLVKNENNTRSDPAENLESARATPSVDDRTHDPSGTGPMYPSYKLPFDLLQGYHVPVEETKLIQGHFISHNIMHASSEHRTTAILNEYSRATVLALQGTRRAQHGQPLYKFKQNGFTIYSAGFAKESGSHAGVLLAFAEKHIPDEHLKSYWIPTNKLLQGRMLGIRQKGQHTDFFHMCLYFPPCSANNATQIVQMMSQQASEVVMALPKRTTPIIYMDANTEFRMVKHTYGVQKVQATSVGEFNNGIENTNAAPIRDFLDWCGLVLVTTMKKMPPTYISGAHKTPKHIDHVAIPLHAFGNSRFYRDINVWQRSARRIQPMKSPILLDHAGVALTLRRHTAVLHVKKDQGIDRDKLMRCVLKGEHRHEWLDAINSKCEQHQELVNEGMRIRSPTILYHAITKAIHEATIEVFPNSKKPQDPEHKQYIKKKFELIKEQQKLLQTTWLWKICPSQCENAESARATPTDKDDDLPMNDSNVSYDRHPHIGRETEAVSARATLNNEELALPERLIGRTVAQLRTY